MADGEVVLSAEQARMAAWAMDTALAALTPDEEPLWDLTRERLGEPLHRKVK